MTIPHAATDIVLSAQGLSKTYGQHTALYDFSCEVKAGEMLIPGQSVVNPVQGKKDSKP